MRTDENMIFRFSIDLIINLYPDWFCQHEAATAIVLETLGIRLYRRRLASTK
jgi:hypothetical protein